ncbi:major capsid protein [Dyella sp. LX-1]|uniref:major capsid protein n=1 Tax=Dyella sp. LX-1 TaxID=2838831 RepID=UPI001BE0ECA5|nr:major capsid protein [Dyella sp. LX-1]MBT2119861.1 phage coat protein [Dyella sp. LX-1]MBT2119872.1 phage coat protein [Dyella sp. LX-1]
MKNFLLRLTDKAGNLKKYAAAALVGGGAAANAAFADGIDVTAVTTVITGVATAAATIGLAVLGMHFGIKAYKWIKGAG